MNLWYIVADWIRHFVSAFFGIMAKIYEGENMAQNDIQKEDWKEISLATRAQILLNYNNLDFSKDDFKLVDIYQKNNKKNLDWFYIEGEHLLVKSAEKTNGKYNFSFWNMDRQDIKKIINTNNIGKIILGCFDIENLKIYRLEITFNEIRKKLQNNKYILTVDILREEFENIFEVYIEEKYFKSWSALSRAGKLATHDRPEGFEGEKEFMDWYVKKEKICCYCGVSEEYLEKYFKIDKSNSQTKKAVKRGRGMRLEIERIKTADGKNEYTKENCTLACYICNNAKSDFLSAYDFKPIAEGINKFWNDYLKKLDPKTEVKFDSGSEIWKTGFDKNMEPDIEK